MKFLSSSLFDETDGEFPALPAELRFRALRVDGERKGDVQTIQPASKLHRGLTDVHIEIRDGVQFRKIHTHDELLLVALH